MVGSADEGDIKRLPLLLRKFDAVTDRIIIFGSPRMLKILWEYMRGGASSKVLAMLPANTLLNVPFSRRSLPVQGRSFVRWGGLAREKFTFFFSTGLEFQSSASSKAAKVCLANLLQALRTSSRLFSLAIARAIVTAPTLRAKSAHVVLSSPITFLRSP